MSDISDSIRPRETEAFLDALRMLPPNEPTACPGWTVHHIAAHVAGSFDEATLHVEAYAADQPVPVSRALEEREPPYRSMSPAELLRRTEEADDRMRRSISALLKREPDAILPWARRAMPVKALLSHLRNECAIHRWDMLGHDEVSQDLLSQDDLLHHSVRAVGRPLGMRGLQQGGLKGRQTFRARISAPGHPDLLIQVAADEPVFSTAPEGSGEPLMRGDAAARLLVLWGRRPPSDLALEAVGPVEQVDTLQHLLLGF